MEITTRTTPTSELPGIPRKPLDNPPRPKPTYASDNELANLLTGVLGALPDHLTPAPGSSFPLLRALIRWDETNRRDVARQLVFIAAVNHRTADERRTAEYLLRHRGAVATGERSSLGLLLAARCAAEMDVRRVHLSELPVPHEATGQWSLEQIPDRYSDRSVPDLVLIKLAHLTGWVPCSVVTRESLLTAVTIALELAERHAINRGSGPALLAMRSDARKPSRLAARLQLELGDPRASRAIARLLVGADHSPIEAAVLWWCAQRHAAPEDVAPDVRARWLRYLRAAEGIEARTQTSPQPTPRRIRNSPCLTGVSC